ncbi:MAG: GNAT family N-acetyltransferase [Bacteroidota bacterium]
MSETPDGLLPRPDEHLCVPGRGSLSLWWKNPPRYREERVGAIGHFEAEDAEAATMLLERACRRLREEGCTLAIGPFDGSTYFRYRAVTEQSDEPRFRLELATPDTWPGFFQAAGFEVLETYHSSLNENLAYRDPRRARVEERLKDVRIRSFRMEEAEEELKRIYRLSEVVFQNNLFFAPITEEDYLRLYRPLLPLVNPELLLLAEHEGREVGFFFSIPAERTDTYIIKSFAILPERRYAGLGNLLVWRSRDIAQRLGFTREIHALMWDGNASSAISSRSGRVIRRYALFARKL